VKIDRMHQFAPDNKYEIAYTESDNGFRNIIGVKRIVQEAAQPKPAQRAIDAQNILLNGGSSFSTTQNLQGTQRQPAPQQVATPSTKASQSEHIFTCGGLYRDIEMGRVGTSEDELVERTILWRNVYRRAFSEE
jgi:hypothetical protein